MVSENTPCSPLPASWVIETSEKIIPVAVLLGPTATGKSALALRITREAGWDIVSCDSRQIYRGMDIGTAKPSVEEMTTVRHWCIDLLDPPEEYSASRFALDAALAIRQATSAGRHVLVCGGTGLYFSALSEGLSDMEPSDVGVRAQLMAEAAVKGAEELYRELTAVDPASAGRLHANDVQRIVRALAVFRQTGRPMSLLSPEKKPPADMRFIIAKLEMPREALYSRINNRVDDMIRSGLPEEFRKLRSRGFNEKCPGMQGVGYRELFDVEVGRCSLAEAVEHIKRNSRRYAKRQTTWFSNKVAGTSFGAEVEWATLLEFFRTNGMGDGPEHPQDAPKIFRPPPGGK